MDFTQATGAPIIEPVNGKDVSFAQLDIIDYLPWAAQLTAQRKVRSKALIPKTADAIDQFRMARIAEFDDANVDAIAALVWTPDGARKVLDMSLIKSGVTDAPQREAIIKAIPARRVVQLAVDVSALFEKKPPPLEKEAENPDPNAAVPPDENAAAV